MGENANPSAPDQNQIQRRIIGGGGGGVASRNQRYSSEEEEDGGGGGGGGGTIKCTGKSCRSCAGGLIADCVALCCCPCAVVNLLTLAFLKVPWMMGRKILGLGKKKKKIKSADCCEEIDDQRRRDSGWGESMMMEDINGILEKDEGISGNEEDNYSARFEAEKVWMELYQVGHLGFGRVSFTGNGIPSTGKGNSGN